MLDRKMEIHSTYNQSVKVKYTPLLIFIILTVAYLLISFGIASKFPELSYRGDFWFGADVSRHIFWTIDLNENSRSYLHPISFILFKGYGQGLNFINVPPQLPFISFPIILLTALSIVLCANILIPPAIFPLRNQLAAILLLVLIGPTLVFAPVPESHVLGGISLLMQAVLIWRIKTSQHTVFDYNYKNLVVWILIFTILATGFSLSNLMPATIMMLSISSFRWPILKIVIGIGLGLMLILILHKFIFYIPEVSQIARRIIKEFNYILYPGFSSFLLSLINVVLAQFGVSIKPVIIQWINSNNNLQFMVVKKGPTILQISASILYLSGILWYLINNIKSQVKEASFIFYCTLALFSIVIFHSFYATKESYIFSAHAWPYLLLPGLVALRNSWKNSQRLPVLFILLALLLTIIQTVIGFNVLFNLQKPY